MSFYKTRILLFKIRSELENKISQPIRIAILMVDQSEITSLFSNPPFGLLG